MKRINIISETDKNAAQRSLEKWNSVAKPLGSLGLLEEMIIKIASVQGTENVDISKRNIVVMCADNGVVEEGVTQSDSEVTAMCAAAIAEGKSNINRIAQTFNAAVTAVDIGINRDVECDSLLKRKAAYGTKNISKENAMTADECESAISVGIDIVRHLKQNGSKIIVTGEMGIGNTTTASAVCCALLGANPETVTGRGAGLDSKGLERKINAVKRALEINQPDSADPFDVLSKVGGFDICGMTGVFLGGAIYKIPVIIDGVISAAAADLAYRINPLCREYMLAGHVSKEPSGQMFLDDIGLKAVINAEMRLGEGTGGAMLLPLLDGALAVYNSAHRFDELGIERYVELK